MKIHDTGTLVFGVGLRADEQLDVRLERKEEGWELQIGQGPGQFFTLLELTDRQVNGLLAQIEQAILDADAHLGWCRACGDILAPDPTDSRGLRLGEPRLVCMQCEPPEEPGACDEVAEWNRASELRDFRRMRG